MLQSIVSKYLEELNYLATNAFEKELLEASLKNLLEDKNKLRFNNFSCGIRELSRHILESLAPVKEVEQCCWYNNESKKAGKLTRREMIKYAIQKGLPDSFVKTFYDVNENIKSILEAINILNKYTHVNPATFDIAEDKILDLSELVLESFRDFAEGIKECHGKLKLKLANSIDDTLIRHTIEKSIDEIDILATHYNIEEIEEVETMIKELNSRQITIQVEGSLETRHQYGSDGDFARGDGLELYGSYPFACVLEITIAQDFNKSDYVVYDFKVNTDSWYE